jgi:hypothetical protein
MQRKFPDRPPENPCSFPENALLLCIGNLLHPETVSSVHLHAGGSDDLTVSFEVPMNASFEFIERRDVGLA